MVRWFCGIAILLAAIGAQAGGNRHTRIEVPLKVTLSGEEAGDRATLIAEVEVRGRLPAAPVLRLQLPEGARLVEGVPEETLAGATEPGQVTRTFVVEGLQGRTATVVAEMVSPGAGARSQASWPMSREAIRVQPTPQAVPIPPVEVRGVRIQQAIPIEPTPR
ncbi:MAG TPA: hypothetical protein PLQ97_04270 [Myxococcota bacterium]|nr:hypothetical protein [Myxococcota bacterium]HQK49928.1 hypothetical protein [Myxococcota bacterium]